MSNKLEADLAELNRRDFLRGGSLATLMTMLGGVQLIAQAPAPVGEEKKAGPKIKVAVIGLGSWGREILATLGRQPQVEIAAICETYPAFLKRAAGAAPNATAVDDFKKILDDKEIKAVVIATPTHKHREIAVAALQAGKHVYCEAPLAHTLEDARAIAQAAKDNAKVLFQPGLQTRSDPQRHFLLPFIRSGAIGNWVMARAQWHKKQSWRATSANPEREKEMNWRLRKETSPGLIGEIGIHQIDAAAWFLNARPTSVAGFGSIAQWKDGREVPDTVQAVFDFPESVRLTYDISLANSFDSDYEVYYGADAAVMVRGNKAWMFKEVDSPLLGWEVYARKDSFYKETGIALVANATKSAAQGSGSLEDSPFPETTLFYALEAFVNNAREIGNAAEDFGATFDANDKDALRKYLATIPLKPAANYKDGFAATVMAIKANEAIVKGEKITCGSESFELA